MQQNTSISIVIPTYFRHQGLKNLLQSICTQNFNHNAVQVIVVANFEDKKTQAVINEYQAKLYDLKYYISGKKGCNIARNFGIRFASCDIVYFLDDDCILDSNDQLSNIVKYHNKYPDAVGVGGGYSERKHKQNVSEIIYSKNQSLWLKRSANEKNETHHLIGGNASYKRKIFSKGYNYNSAISFGGSEVSLTKKLYDDGYKLLYFEELNILHDLKVGVLSVLKKGFMQGKGKYLNCNKEEAQKFAGFIKNIIPSQQNTIELNSSYQKCIWYMFHFMFKMGFHWSMYCGENNLSSWNIFGFIGAMGYFKKHFTYVSKSKNEQSIKVAKNTANRFRYKTLKGYYRTKRVYYFFRRNSRLFFIKSYWYLHAIYNVVFRKIILNRIILKLFRRIYKKTLMYARVYKLRIRTLSYYTIVKPSRKFIRPILVKLYWLPNELRKFTYKVSRKFYSYVLVKLFWLPNEIRKLAYKYGRLFRVYVLVKLFWLPNEIRKLVYKYGRLFRVYVLVKLFWLPNEMRKFAYKWGRKFYVYVLVKLYWLPNEIRKFCYRYGRFIYGHTKGFLIRYGVRSYWLVRKLLYKLQWFLRHLKIWGMYGPIRLLHGLKVVYFNFLSPIVLKPYYFLQYQIGKRLKRKVSRGKS